MPIIIFLIILIGLYVSDPLQLIHTYSKKKGFVSNERHQVLRIINHYPFDSIILGTSMLQNTSSKESSKMLGGNFVNLSLSGSDFNTRSIILNYILKKKILKKVIYSLDDIGLVQLKMRNTSNFDFLYDDNKFNDVRVYINSNYLRCSLFNSYCLTNRDIDRPYAWYRNNKRVKRFGGLNNWFKENDNIQNKNTFKEILISIKNIKLNKKNIDINLQENILKSKKYINDNIIRYVSNYPNTEFILLLPPYSRISYAIDAKYNVSSFEKYKLNIKYLVTKSNEYTNLKIYGWGNNAFLDNIANYRDLHHYEYKINSWMIDAIKKEEGLLTVNNVDNYLELFTTKAFNYNLFELEKKINYYINTK